MALYYCNETDSVVSTEGIRQDFDMFRSEGSYTDTSFDEYLDGCMYWNNGALIPLAEYVDGLRRELNRSRSWDDTDWTDSLTARIADYEKMMEV